MSASSTLRATAVVLGMVGWIATGGGCTSTPGGEQDQIAIGALPELVMAMQQPPSKAEYAALVLNPPRSTMKFTGKTVKLETKIETQEPISFTIAEDSPGDPGSDGKYASFQVVFGPDPSKPGMVARGALHQSNPYFNVESGWAYFAGSAAMGSTGRVRTTPDSTEYFIQIDDSDQAVQVHRIINVSQNPNHKVRIICPPTDQGATIHTIDAGSYAEINNNNCVISGQGLNVNSGEVTKFLESVGGG
jgi:hypothetical protein